MEDGENENYIIETTIPNPYAMRMIITSFAKNSQQVMIQFHSDGINFQAINPSNKVYTSYEIDANSVLYYKYDAEKPTTTIHIIFSSLYDNFSKVKKTHPYIILRLTKNGKLSMTSDSGSSPIQTIEKIGERVYPTPYITYLTRIPNDVISKMIPLKSVHSLRFQIVGDDIMITVFNKTQTEISKIHHRKGIQNLEISNLEYELSIDVNLESIVFLKNIEKANTRGVCKIGTVEDGDFVNLVLNYKGDNYSSYTVIVPGADN
jgi:hypothetical protein